MGAAWAPWLARWAWLPAVVLLLSPAPSSARFQPAPYDSFENARITGIGILGARITKPYVIRREIETKSGQPLRAATIAGDVRRLHDLGIFGHVDVGATADSGGVALEYRVTEIPWLLAAPSLSYSDANGWSYGASVASVNLLGRDMKLMARALFGGVTTYSAQLADPWITGNHFGAQMLLAHLVREDYLDGFEETSDQYTPEVSSWIGEFGRLRSIFTWFRMESDVDGKTLSADNVDYLHQLGVGITYDSRNSRRYATRGWYLDLGINKTGGALGGNGDFWTNTLDLRRYQSTRGQQCLLVAGLLSLQTGTVGTTIPEYLQYRMGGENTIRGYQLDSLGAELYGINQLIGTLEYQIPLVPLQPVRIFKWTFRLGLNAALFSDQGIAWNESEDLALDRFKVGGGVGLRLLVPGSEVIRLDLGIGDGVHVAMAALEKVFAQRKRVR